MEDNKLNRRSRPRPYDLRRKVLMKNFFKEQMTYIPPTLLRSSLLSGDEESTDESPDSSELKDHPNTSDKATNESSSNNSNEAEGYEDRAPIPPPQPVEKETLMSSSPNSITVDTKIAEPQLFNFTSLLNIGKDRQRKKVTGIVKAKLLQKPVKSPAKKSKSFRSGLKRLLSVQSKASKERSTSDSATKSSSKSLIALFKSQREQRKSRQAAQSSTSDAANETTSTTNQSVQTDSSWAQEELTMVEQSNKLLKEENRLLSESLSFFMSSNSLDSQVKSCNSPLQPSIRNVRNIRRYPGCSDSLSSCSSYGYNNNNWNSNSRVLRSKSLRESRERRISSSYPYRTRSMNFHYNLSDFHAGPMTSSAQYTPLNSSRDFRQRTVLTSLPVSNGRIIQRRSSMPERVLSENERSRICRRSSLRNGRTPFHSLPSEAFY